MQAASAIRVPACTPHLRTANACRTTHVFVTPPSLHTSARKREDAGASPGSLSCDTDYQLQCQTAGDGPRRDEIAAMVVERVDLARKPLRLGVFLFDLRNLA